MEVRYDIFHKIWVISLKLQIWWKLKKIYINNLVKPEKNKFENVDYEYFPYSKIYDHENLILLLLEAK